MAAWGENVYRESRADTRPQWSFLRIDRIVMRGLITCLPMIAGCGFRVGAEGP